MVSIKWFDGIAWQTVGEPDANKIKTDSADTRPSYLDDKLSVSTSFTKEVINTGSDDNVLYLSGNPATESTLGMVKVGPSLSIDGAGVLSAPTPAGMGLLWVDEPDTVSDYLSNKLQFSPQFKSEIIDTGAGLIYYIAGNPASAELGMIKSDGGVTISEDGTLSVTKSQVGLGNVTNDAQIPLDQKGVAEGVAELDNTGKVPPSQLPNFLNDVEEYVNLAGFPATGDANTLYVALDTSISYRWSGTVYAAVSQALVLGETSTTSYRGDRGAIAYDHSQVAHAPANAQKNSDITKGEIEAQLTGAISTHTHDYAPDGYGLGSLLSATTLTSASTGDALVTGMYFLDGAAEDKPADAYDGALFVMAYSAIWVCQTFMDWRTNRYYARSCTDGEWGDWEVLYMGSNGAPLDSPTFVGVPVAPTANIGTDTTQLATTAFVNAQILNDAQPVDQNLVSIVELEGNTGLLRKLAANTWSLDTVAYAPLNNPALIGIPTAPTAEVNTSTTQLATTAFVTNEISVTSQPLDPDLTAIGDLAGTTGLLRKTDSNTWILDTTDYLTTINKDQVESVLTGTISTHTHTNISLEEYNTGVPWTVTSVSTTARPNKGYIANGVGQVVITLPVTAPVGTVIRVVGSGVGGWRVAQNAGQIIHWSSRSTTTGTGGYITCAAIKDSLELVCVIENTTFIAVSAVGNLIIA